MGNTRSWPEQWAEPSQEEALQERPKEEKARQGESVLRYISSAGEG